MSSWFNLGRIWPYPTLYQEWKTPVTQDVLIIGWVAAFFALLLPFYVVIPASNNKISRLFRVTFFLLLGLSIMLCNFGQGWEVGSIRTRTQYRAGTTVHIKADIGVYMSLRSVNITLKGKPEKQENNTNLDGETIDYNERFTWTWSQGRPGFGPYAGQIQRDYRAAQHRGAPYPILWIAEYFTFDGEGIRFGRYYRTSGWYAHIFVWAAFPMWLMTVFLFKMIVKYAAVALGITGILMVIPAIIWASNRNPVELQIPFEAGLLTTKFGWCWYLALGTGIICIIIAGTLLYALRSYNDELNEIFGTNPWKIVDLDDQIVDEDPIAKPASDYIEMDSMGNPVPKECKRQVTIRGRGMSSHSQNTKLFEVPRALSDSGSNSSQNFLSTPSVSPTQKLSCSSFDNYSSHQSTSAGRRLASVEEGSECHTGTASIDGHEDPFKYQISPCQVHDSHDDDNNDHNDHLPVFESPKPVPRRSPNLTLNIKEF